VSLIVNNEEYLFSALADTGSRSRIILEADISVPFIKIDDSNITNGSTMGGLQIKLRYACDLFIARIQSEEINIFFLGISGG
jgi:hypothetical protein